MRNIKRLIKNINKKIKLFIYFYKMLLEVLKHDPENIEAKALSGQNALNIPTAEPTTNNVIIGSDKDNGIDNKT